MSFTDDNSEEHTVYKEDPCSSSGIMTVLWVGRPMHIGSIAPEQIGVPS